MRKLWYTLAFVGMLGLGACASTEDTVEEGADEVENAAEEVGEAAEEAAKEVEEEIDQK